MSISPVQFREFFSAVHGDEAEPFPWQERLLRRVAGTETGESAESAWPEVISLPTGSGKTTCLDIAIFSLACQAGTLPNLRTAPRRILFVVDRRVIVDEAYEHARKLQKKLKNPDSSILRDVADALRNVNGGNAAEPLTCHQLRGGIYRDDEWARTPSQPCVICSTVDQIGSRLLFRGYGKSNTAWPLHAGLAANDSLIILDEAHCANPFMQTMRAIRKYRSEAWAKEPIAGPFHFTVMSATPPAKSSSRFSFDFAPDGCDLSGCHVLRSRVLADKPIRLDVASKAKGERALEELAIRLVDEAAQLVTEQRQRIGILVNRVRTARLVRDLLEGLQTPNFNTAGFDQKVLNALRKKLPYQVDTVLMTGRTRAFDRDKALYEWAPAAPNNSEQKGLLTWFGTSANRPPVPRPAFVIATQCLEVGANLDFDAMVCECASLDALRQRFGRLNRTGRMIDARGAIVIRADQTSKNDPDPVYAESIANTYRWLLSQAAVSGDGQAEVNFGIGALQPAIDGIDASEYLTLVPPAPDAPVMLPSHVDCWVQTSPVPRPDPDVSIFLHGPEAGMPEVQICWRADLEPTGQEGAVASVGLCPPVTAECLSVPLYVFRNWWQSGSYSRADSELTDIEGRGRKEPDPARIADGQLWAVNWRGPESGESRVITSLDNVKPGSVLVLPAALGGWDVLGDVPRPDMAENADLDIVEVCHWQTRGRATLRLHWAILQKIFDAPVSGDADSAIHNAVGRLTQMAGINFNSENSEEPDLAQVYDDLQLLLDQKILGPQYAEIVSELLHEQHSRGPKPKFSLHSLAGVVIRGVRNVAPEDRGDIGANFDSYTTDDETACETVRVLLAAHCRAVGEKAVQFGTACGFPAIVLQSLRAAGELHDLGKADPRFQAVLHGGNRLLADLSQHLYAKSTGLAVPRKPRVFATNDLPRGFRHEQLSVMLAEHWPESVAEVADRDLVLHLVGMHHGRCRPLADVVIDEDPPEFSLARIGSDDSRRSLVASPDVRRQWTPAHRLNSDVADRFWRLVRRFGWWGLAWIEAVFLLADYRTSEDEVNRASQSDRIAEDK
jgi:CRISPR-associated endonuclease/helicase Cas3